MTKTHWSHQPASYGRCYIGSLPIHGWQSGSTQFFFGYRNLQNKASLWGGVLLKNENAMVYHPFTHYTDDLVYPAFLGQTNLHVAGSIPNGMPIPLYIRTLFP